MTTTSEPTTEPTIEQITDWLRERHQVRLAPDRIDRTPMDAALLWWKYCAPELLSFAEIRERVPGAPKGAAARVQTLLGQLMRLQTNRGVPILESLPPRSRLAYALRPLVQEKLQWDAEYERLAAEFPGLDRGDTWFLGNLTTREQACTLDDEALWAALGRVGQHRHQYWAKTLFARVRAAAPYQPDPCPCCGGTGRRKTA